MAKSDDDALKRALLQFDRKFGLGAADELVLYFNVCPVEEEDE